MEPNRPNTQDVSPSEAQESETAIPDEALEEVVGGVSQPNNRLDGLGNRTVDLPTGVDNIEDSEDSGI